MELEKVIKSRYSVRKYKPDMLSDEAIDAILEAGMVAPTGCNYQPQRVYVLKSEESIAKIRQLCRSAFNAPVVLIVALDENADWKNPYEEGYRAGIQDVSIVADHMMLTAWDLGIGSCWVNAFRPSDVKEAFSLPENELPVLLLPLGYPAEESTPSKLHTASKTPGELIRVL
jgi:nitroreductase